MHNSKHTIKLRPYQQESRIAVQKEWEKGNIRTLLVLPTGCHKRGQKLLMANGTTKAVENILIGDRLMGMDGTARTVIYKKEGYDTLYLVEPVKGNPFIVTGDHKLTLERINEKSRKKYPCDFLEGELTDITVKDWLKWSKTKKHVHKLIRSKKIINFEESTNILPIDPYFLGLLLGDGDIVNSISITTMDPEVAKEIKHQCDIYKMNFRTQPTGKALTYIFQSGELGINGSMLHRQLKKLGLRRLGCHEKFIPHIYKTSSVENRAELIAGLIDTDGSCVGTGYDYISASKKMAEDVVFICRSLGLAAYLKTCKKTSQSGFVGTYYRVSISGNCTIIPCKIERKKAKIRKQKKNVLRTGFSVKKIGKGSFVGLTVDGDNRYLMDDFTITHNCGKTIVFSKIIEDRVRKGERVLVLAHRGELLEQAADKLEKSTGLKCATEKAEKTSIGSWYRVVVGSVQTLMREKRLNQFDPDFFDVIVVDEAHHCISDSYQNVLRHFNGAKVLGVTATPDRSDMKDLGTYFQSLAYEYTLPKAIKEGYLSPIKALTIPLKLDITSVGMQSGDFKAGELGTALDPYLKQIAAEMWKVAKDRKIVVFLPLVKTSQKFTELLNKVGFKAAEVNGESDDRSKILQDFDSGRYNVLCNSMLLTEGWDCPSVDCVVMLRATKSRALYSQCVGRGTRLSPETGKKELLLLDFLWLTERHELCHPAHLVATNDEVAQAMTKKIEESPAPVDIEEAEKTASEDVQAQREEALAEKLAAMKRRKRKLVDPLQFEMSIQAEDLSGYKPSFGWEAEKPSEQQVKKLEKLGILPDEIGSAGKASKLLDRLDKRRKEGLTTPKQIRFLESRGFQHVGTWPFDGARKLIDRIAASGWHTPADINPAEYKPEINALMNEMSW